MVAYTLPNASPHRLIPIYQLLVCMLDIRLSDKANPPTKSLKFPVWNNNTLKLEKPPGAVSLAVKVLRERGHSRPGGGLNPEPFAQQSLRSSPSARSSAHEVSLPSFRHPCGANRIHMTLDF